MLRHPHSDIRPLYLRFGVGLHWEGRQETPWHATNRKMPPRDHYARCFPPQVGHLLNRERQCGRFRRASPSKANCFERLADLAARGRFPGVDEASRAPPAIQMTPFTIPPTHEEIANRAFLIWCRTGRRPETAIQNWHAAERDLQRERQHSDLTEEQDAQDAGEGL